MVLAKWKKGTDCEFQIELFEDDGTTPISIDALLDMRCHLYTISPNANLYPNVRIDDLSKKNITHTITSEKVLFSKTDKTLEGYIQLIKISPYIYKVILEGVINKDLLAGVVVLAIWTATTNAQISTGRFKSAGSSEIAVLEEISTVDEE
jgi:hypothetical protein